MGKKDEGVKYWMSDAGCETSLNKEKNIHKQEHTILNTSEIE